MWCCEHANIILWPLFFSSFVCHSYCSVGFQKVVFLNKGCKIAAYASVRREEKYHVSGILYNLLSRYFVDITWWSFLFTFVVYTCVLLCYGYTTCRGSVFLKYLSYGVVIIVLLFPIFIRAIANGMNTSRESSEVWIGLWRDGSYTDIVCEEDTADFFFFFFFTDEFGNKTISDIKCTFWVTSLTCQSKLCNVMYIPPPVIPMYMTILAQTIKLDIQFVFLWMGLYVYVFKNKYCCLLVLFSYSVFIYENIFVIIRITHGGYTLV